MAFQTPSYAAVVSRFDVPPEASGGVSAWMHTVGAVLAGRSATGRGRIQRGGSAPLHEQTTIARMPGGGALVCHVDVTVLVERCARLEHLARHDPLTGALNVRGLQAGADAMLSAAKRHGRVVRIFAIDVEDFKAVNDRFGHAAGDAVLAAIAERLRASLREGDLVARVGGDEFAVVAQEASGAEELADRLRRDLAALTAPGSAPASFRLRVSVGAATFPDDGEELAGLLACADSRMYRTKRRRR